MSVPKRPVRSRADLRLKEATVTVVGLTASRIMCRDNFGNDIEIEATVAPKGAVPQPGERWIVRRIGNLWVPMYEISERYDFPIIYGSRDGMGPVEQQVLEAMSRLGLVQDATVPGFVPFWDDTNDPPDDDPTEPDPEPLPDPPQDPPPDDPGPQDPDPEPPHPSGQVPLYLGSYNMRYTIGPERAYQDLARLGRTKMEVLGLQEMGAPSRGTVTARFAQGDWQRWRPDNIHPETMIVWRGNRFDLLDKGAFYLAPEAHTTRSARVWGARVLSWVKLRQKASGRVFFFASVHTFAHTEGHTNWHTGPYQAGHPSSDPQLREVMEKTFLLYRNLRDTVREWGKKAPVFVVGDFNINFFSDRAVADPRFPYVQLGRVHTYSNWDLVKHHPSYGTHGNRYIDQLWVTRPEDWRVRLTDQWILTGYHSDHKPVLVKAMLRR